MASKYAGAPEESSQAIAVSKSPPPAFGSTKIPIPARRENRVIVKAGSTLSTIIVDELGKYNDILLDEVLTLNPDISNPDLIEVGQIITLPQVHIN